MNRCMKRVDECSSFFMRRLCLQPKKTAKNCLYRSNDLGCGFSPIEKYAGQIGLFPNERMKTKKYLNCHPTSNYGLEL